jgi:hypothetical protein
MHTPFKSFVPLLIDIRMGAALSQTGGVCRKLTLKAGLDPVKCWFRYRQSRGPCC